MKLIRAHAAVVVTISADRKTKVTLRSQFTANIDGGGIRLESESPSDVEGEGYIGEYDDRFGRRI